MHYNYSPKGVCTTNIEFDLEDGKIYNLSFKGGCNGNLKAISKLADGMDAAKVEEVLTGNTCGARNTSCADQLARAIKQAIEQG